MKQSNEALATTPQQTISTNTTPILEWIFIISCAIIGIGMVVSSFYYGLSGDEAYANGMGKAAWKYITSFGSDDSIFHQPDQVNRDGVLTYYGNIFDIICIWFNKISPWDEYTTRHIINAMVGFLGIFFSAKIIKKYFGTWPAIICLWLMVFYPFYFGHAMNNPKDVPLASFYIMGIYFLLQFFDRLDHLKVTDYLWLIISIILAIDVRVAGILIIAYLPVFGLLNFKQTMAFINSKGWVKGLLPFAIVAICSYLGCSIFWPYAAQNPLSNPLEALSFLSDFKISLGQIWEGVKVPSNELPSNYLIRSIYITSPYVFLIGLVLMLVTVILKWKSLANKHIILFIAFISIFPLGYIMYKGSNVYHLWRHVLFVFPGFAILSALGWYYSSSIVIIKHVKLIATALFVLCLLEPIIFTAKTFPQSVNYYNASIGGTEEAYGQFEMDFYYNSLKPCVDYMNKEVLASSKDSILIGSNADHLLRQYYKDSKLKVKNTYVRYPERNMKEWDYGIFHISLIPLEEIQAGIWGQGGQVFSSKVLDKPLCVVLKRPSLEDLNVFKYIDAKEYASAYASCLKYLEKDPSNPMMLDIKSKLSAAAQPIAQ
jgi:hypothetical protein